MREDKTMPYIADLHIHSRYSRATSRDMCIESLSKWAGLKGINLLGTGDCTHPRWLAELETVLREKEYGIYYHGGIEYLLTAEISNIFFKNGRVRKVHTVLFVPSFAVAKKIQRVLSKYGSIESDGRPTLNVSCAELMKELAGTDPDIMYIPAHVWTPHFGALGSGSGFDSIEECYGDCHKGIVALETGLSSDPPMNWRLSSLDRYTLISNSDAHSPPKIGREANVFGGRVGYRDLRDILRTKDSTRFLYTLEFFPEEGKYHWDGHRKCKVRLSPEESAKINYRCPHCGRKMTVGVMNRVHACADRNAGTQPAGAPGYKSLVPLAEIIAAAMGLGRDSVTVTREYNTLIQRLGNEFHILLYMPENEIRAACPPRIAEGIMNVRAGKVRVTPGYDGVYGTIDIFSGEDSRQEKQLEFF